MEAWGDRRGKVGSGYRPPEASRPRTLTLAGGVVAYNEERNVGRAIRSLLDQELPKGVRWTRIWVVASGCTDRTVERARAEARGDPRVEVVEEEERGGKARAMGEVLGRARGDAVVLLNSDAIAEPGAVRELVETARGQAPPYAVMARPVVPQGLVGGWSRTLELMWELHHEFHLLLQAEGGGAHLSDELLLLSLDPPPPLPAGIINDGSYFGVWLAQHRCPRLYATGARVSIELPGRLRDHLAQRRRIHVGNSQVAATLGRQPSTLGYYALRRPRSALRIWGRSIRGRRSGALRLASLGMTELAAMVLATWDRIPPERDHVRWQRVRTRATAERAPVSDRPTADNAPPSHEVDRRVRTLLEVASEFRTGVPLPRLMEILPASAPATPGDLERWLRERPVLARLAGEDVFSPAGRSHLSEVRSRLALTYSTEAERLFQGPLLCTIPWLRCVGVSGSASYGAPEPGDDLDFFVVTRRGALWWFLAIAFLKLRLSRRAGPVGCRPEPCFNYALDDGSALEVFRKAHGLLFAREALTVRVLEGDPYYRGLLAAAPWIAQEIPRLYETRSLAPGSCRPEPAPILVRALNAAVFLPLAAYLQLKGLRRNARPARGRRDSAGFRTATGFHRLALVSERFEALRRRYEPGLPTAASGGSSGGPSRVPAAR